MPVSAGTLDALRRYHDRRVAVAPADLTGAFFVSGRGTGYSTSTVQALFHDLTVQTGLREPDGRGPRLHDLRATFAVTRLLSRTPSTPTGTRANSSSGSRHVIAAGR